MTITDMRKRPRSNCQTTDGSKMILATITYSNISSTKSVSQIPIFSEKTWADLRAKAGTTVLAKKQWSKIIFLMISKQKCSGRTGLLKHLHTTGPERNSSSHTIRLPKHVLRHPPHDSPSKYSCKATSDRISYTPNTITRKTQPQKRP